MEYKRDKAIKDITRDDEILDIITRSKVCYLGMVDGETPYVLGFNFGYQDGVVYLHCARYGRKLDILEKNNKVCLYFNTDTELFSRHEEIACSWRMRYRSVQAYGNAEIVEDYDEKVRGLEIFMKNYSDREFTFSKPSVDNVCIIR
ncbi:MAG: pyridoxamine 5'-phosphate oxidase family protein, partial [Bacteroidota bacterium]